MGVPSWMAMWDGVGVMCTDQSIVGRISCFAERAKQSSGHGQTSTKGDTTISSGLLVHANEEVRESPYD